MPGTKAVRSKQGDLGARAQRIRLQSEHRQPRGNRRFGQVIRAVPRLELANLALNHKRLWQCKRGEFPAPPATSTVFADLGAAAGLHLQRRIKKICVVARGRFGAPIRARARRTTADLQLPHHRNLRRRSGSRGCAAFNGVEFIIAQFGHGSGFPVAHRILACEHFTVLISFTSPPRTARLGAFSLGDHRADIDGCAGGNSDPAGRPSSMTVVEAVVPPPCEVRELRVPVAPRGNGPQARTCCLSACSWLHLLKSWSLRQTRSGSAAH